MNFIPTNKDVFPAKLVELDAGNGPFYIANAGGRPDFEHCFFYGDDKYEFFFYAKWVKMPDIPSNIEVYYASSGRLTGMPPKINSTYKEIIQQNISYLFNVREFSIVRKPRSASDALGAIIFSWKI